jgi:hypothetical protein
MMNHSEATSDTKGKDEAWHVQLASGELRVMSLDQLDDAFQNGLVSEDTFVYQPGMNDWIKLADLAGLDADADETPAAGSIPAADVAPAPPPVAHPAIAPVSMSPAIASSFPIAVPAPVIEHIAGASPPASLDPFAPPISLAANPLFAPTFGPYSTAPVAADKPDLEFDSELDFRRRKSSRGKWVLVAAGLGAVGVAGMGMSQGWFARPSAAAAVELPPLPAPTPLAENVAPAPAAEALAPKPTADTTRLTDDTRRALLDADKVRADKARTRQRVVRTAAPRGRPAKSATPFHKGGNPHDPLNSSL